MRAVVRDPFVFGDERFVVLPAGIIGPFFVGDLRDWLDLDRRRRSNIRGAGSSKSSNRSLRRIH